VAQVDYTAPLISWKRHTPVVRQSEAGECALACLAMVAGYHGYRTDLSALRQKFQLSLKGATLKQMIYIAEQLGLSGRPVRSELDQLDQLELPAILHWNMDHFVVLTRISGQHGGRRYHLHDPAAGAIVLAEKAFSRSFTGVALELTRTPGFKPRVEKTKFGIFSLWTSMRGFWSTLSSIVLLALVMQAVMLASPFYLQISIDTILPSADGHLLFILAFGFAGLALIGFVASWLRSLVIATLNSLLSYQIVVNLFRHLSQLPLTWFERRHVGDIVSRFGSTRPISQLLSQGMVAAFVDGAMAILTLLLMFIYSAQLSFLALAALAVYAVIRVSFTELLRVKNFDAITTAARENSAFIETVRGMAAIKAFGEETGRQRVWQQTKADAVNAEIKLARFSAGFDAGSQFVVAIERIIFVYLAIQLALKAELSVGMLFAFQAYKQHFLDASMRLVDQVMNIRVIQVHLGRISDIATSPREEADTVAPLHMTDETASIRLKEVHFRYGVGEPEILKNVNFEVKPGECIAIVGPSGGGKTTLVKIMMGLMPPTFGRVFAASQQLGQHSVGGYRRQIASVAQDDTLFAGSLADNIAFFDPDFEIERVQDAARQACIHDEIEAFPLKYHTLVGDMGSTLSGGQRQRVLLARALYKQPSILFLDEGTAHLDPHVEAAVSKSIADLRITRVIIAHRTQAIQAADRCFFVANGAVSEVPKMTAQNDEGHAQPKAPIAGGAIN
jgi:ATP-binding cassette subfamily B protein RaxB